MKLSSRRRDHADINLTALIDIVFLLLIFFMVSTTFDRFAELQITLPEADGEAAPIERKLLELVIDAEGRYYIDQQQVLNSGIETLVRALKKSVGDDTFKPLVINADARTPHQAVITAMDAARRIGMSQISFVIKEPVAAAAE